MLRLPDECSDHPDRSYVNLMAAIAMQSVTSIDEAIEVMDDLREHERHRVVSEISTNLLVLCNPEDKEEIE